MKIVGKLVAAALVVAVVGVPAAFGRGGATISVSSSLDGKTVLPLRSHWLGYTDLPASQVDHVDFLIDGKVRWVEHNAPYNYGSDERGTKMGYLITTWLTPGPHRFVVRVTAKTGQTAKDAFTARVLAPPAPPPLLAGTWTRTQPNTSKHWKGWRMLLWFDRVGAWYAPVSPAGRSPGGLVDQFDVRGHTLDLYAPVIQGQADYVNGHCRGNGCVYVTRAGLRTDFDGNVCNWSGPFGRYSWSRSGDTLTLKVIREGCFGRSEFLQGTWTRTG